MNDLEKAVEAIVQATRDKGMLVLPTTELEAFRQLIKGILEKYI